MQYEYATFNVDKMTDSVSNITENSVYSRTLGTYGKSVPEWRYTYWNIISSTIKLATENEPIL